MVTNSILGSVREVSRLYVFVVARIKVYSNSGLVEVELISFVGFRLRSCWLILAGALRNGHN